MNWIGRPHSHADDWRQMVHDCEQREERLSDWERGFIDSIGRRLDANGGLTPKQSETLEEIWDRATLMRPIKS